MQDMMRVWQNTFVIRILAVNNIHEMSLLLIFSIGIKGVTLAKMAKIINFMFYAQKCLLVWGHYIPNFYRVSGTRIPQD